MKNVTKKLTALSMIAVSGFALASCGFEAGEPFVKKDIDLESIVFKDTTDIFSSSQTEYKLIAKVGNEPLTADKIEGLRSISYTYYDETGERVGSISTVGSYTVKLELKVNEALYNTVAPIEVKYNVYNAVDTSNIVFNDTNVAFGQSVSNNVSVKVKVNGVLQNWSSSNKVTGIDSISYSYEGINGTTYESSSTAPTATGTYKVTAKFNATKNYAAPEDMAATMKILKTVPMAGIEFKSASFLADDTAHGIEVNETPTGVTSVSYKVNGKDGNKATNPGLHEVVANFNVPDDTFAVDPMKAYMYIYEDANTLSPSSFNHANYGLFKETAESTADSKKYSDISISSIVGDDSLQLGNFELSDNINWFYATGDKTATDSTTFGKNTNYLKVDNGDTIKINATAGQKLKLYIACSSSKGDVGLFINGTSQKIAATEPVKDEVQVVEIPITETKTNVLSVNGSTYKIYEARIEGAGSSDTPTITDHNYSFDPSSLTATSDKQAITTFGENSPLAVKTSSNDTIMRTNSTSGVVEKIETKNDNLTVTFQGTGTITISFASTGGAGSGYVANVSALGLKDSNGHFLTGTTDATLIVSGNQFDDCGTDASDNKITVSKTWTEADAGAYYVAGTTYITVTYTITEAGTYTISSPSGTTGRGARINSITLVDRY